MGEIIEFPDNESKEPHILFNDQLSMDNELVRAYPEFQALYDLLVTHESKMDWICIEPELVGDKYIVAAIKINIEAFTVPGDLAVLYFVDHFGHEAPFILLTHSHLKTVYSWSAYEHKEALLKEIANVTQFP